MTRTEAAQSPTRDGRVVSMRRRVRSWPGGRITWRVAVTFVGLAVIAGGIVLLPLPGPGWLIIFAGLGILATEYEWAARLLTRGRTVVRRWTEWAAQQRLWMRVALGLLGLIVVAGLVLAAWFISR